MKKIAIVLMIITVFSKTFGFARDILLSYFYGTSNISDAYLISTTIPMVVFSFIGTGITTGYIPLYSKIVQNHGISEGDKYTNNLVNIIISICAVIVILGLLFTNEVVGVFASGFKGDTLNLTIQFTQISLLGVFFTGLVYIFNGYLQLQGNYIVPTLVGFPLNFIIILSIFLSTKINIIVLSIGSVIANMSQLILLLPFVYKKGYRYKFALNVNDDNIRTMVHISIPVIIGVSVNQINTLIDRTLASQIIVGGISALNYANKLNGFIQGLFVLSIATVMYPMISKLAAENRMTELKKSLSEAINSINLFILPVTIGSMVFAEPIIRLLFGRGAFDINAISMTSSALYFYSIGMIGVGLREVLSRAFYSMQDTKSPMINAAIGMILNIILNIILSKYIGIGGLALATSIAAIFTTILMFISLRKKIGPFGMKKISISFLKILFASLVMGAIARLSLDYLMTNIFSQNLSLLASIGISVVIYFIIIYFMKIEDVDVIINTIKRKIKRNVEV